MPVDIQCLHSPIVLHPMPPKFVISVQSGLSVSFFAFAIRRIHCQILDHKICLLCFKSVKMRQNNVFTPIFLFQDVFGFCQVDY